MAVRAKLNKCARCRIMPAGCGPNRFCSIECRFLAKVNFSTAKGGCWIWTATRHGKGYGHFRLGNRIEKAHRIAYQLFRGPIPSGEDVCHKCDVPSCVNPDHLWTGLNEKNKEDRQRKRNQARGERHAFAKLTEADVIEIRASSESYAVLAQRKGVTESAVVHAALGRSWAYLNAIVSPREHHRPWRIKLTKDAVRDIRKNFQRNRKHFMEKYGVSESVVYQAFHGVTWKHVRD